MAEKQSDKTYQQKRKRLITITAVVVLVIFIGYTILGSLLSAVYAKDSTPEGDGAGFCYGLRDQVGVLWDGTVVPCCLDHEGDISLGNLYDQPLEEILSSPRAQAIYQGFSQGRAREALCRRCGFMRRFR